MLNSKAYESLNYSLSLLSTSANGKYSGCIINSLHQVTSSFPPRFTVTVNKSNETCKALEVSGSFAVTLLTADCPTELVNLFGYKSGRVTDKFAGKDVQLDEAGNPYLKEHMVSRISCKIVDRLEVGNYVLYVGQATESEVLSGGPALTPKEFTKRGNATPTTASVYRTVQINGYRCTVCGYVYEAESLPADFRCPLCNAPADKFQLIEK